MRHTSIFATLTVTLALAPAGAASAATYGGEAGKPEWRVSEDLEPPKVKLKKPRYPVRWRRATRSRLRARCHEQCTATTGLLLLSKGRRAQKLGVSERVLTAGKFRTLPFPEIGKKGIRAIRGAALRRTNARLLFRLRFDDLAGNSRLKTVRIRLRR